MPVDLAHGARCNGEESHREVRGDVEDSGVDNFNRTPRYLVWALLRKMICVGLVLRKIAGRTGNVLADFG